MNLEEVVISENVVVLTVNMNSFQSLYTQMES